MWVCGMCVCRFVYLQDVCVCVLMYEVSIICHHTAVSVCAHIYSETHTMPSSLT